MRTVRTVSELRAALSEGRGAGHSIGLVPTMGAFHDGHLSLIRRAREDCDVVVVSLFVNPSQFVDGEDLERYPRDERRDAALAAGLHVDFLFAPSVEELYPAGFATLVEVSGLTDVLCGAPSSRGAAHFHGVTTVVTKLLNICSPDIAYFGQKDFQQALVIQRLVRDLDIPVRIEVCPTVRDADGLALSSRNAYLDPRQRQRARALKRAIDAAEAEIAGRATLGEAKAAAEAVLAGAGVTPEYVAILSAADLGTPRWSPGERVVIALAARVGPARLIDNSVVELPARTGVATAGAVTAAEPVPR